MLSKIGTPYRFAKPFIYAYLQPAEGGTALRARPEQDRYDLRIGQVPEPGLKRAQLLFDRRRVTR